MPTKKIYPLIFTDLDGTLLDHHSYSARPADALIKKLHEREIADVMPVTSKTLAEISWLARDIDFKDAVKVSENGSLIHAPKGFPFISSAEPEEMLLGVSYADILAATAGLPEDLRRHINGFSAMTAADVAEHTGLALDAAKRAQARQATEPFLWSGTPEQMKALRAYMADVGIQIQQGGRFYHLTGDATKSQALSAIVKAYEKQCPDRKYISIALGDGPNDLAMIEAADYGIIIPNKEGPAIQSQSERVRTATEAGPKGWSLAVTGVLTELGVL